jgi:hypothetical protein
MLTQKLQARIVWGDWDNDTVRIDHDNTILDEVKLWAYRATFWFKLEGFLILESSHKNYVVKQKGRIFFKFRKGSYLIIFNRPVNWTKNMHISNWYAHEVRLESGNNNVQNYVEMQCIKETSTVRISRKNKKPIPKIIFRYGLQDKQVKKYLETRKLILSFLGKR